MPRSIAHLITDSFVIAEAQRVRASSRFGRSDPPANDRASKSASPEYHIAMMHCYAKKATGSCSM